MSAHFFQLFALQIPSDEELARSFFSKDETVGIPVVYDAPISFGRVEIKITRLEGHGHFQALLKAIKHQLDFRIPMDCVIEGFFGELDNGHTRLRGVLNLHWDPYQELADGARLAAQLV